MDNTDVLGRKIIKEKNFDECEICGTPQRNIDWIMCDYCGDEGLLCRGCIREGSDELDQYYCPPCRDN